MNSDEKIKEAIALYRAGNKALAQRLLSEVVKADVKNEIAWIWLSACVENADQKRYCLKRVLSLNPANENAAKALADLEQLPQPSIDDIASSPVLSAVNDVSHERKKTSLKSDSKISPQLIIVGLTAIIFVLGIGAVSIVAFSSWLRPSSANGVAVSETQSNPVAATSNERDPTRTVPASTPNPAAACQPSAQRYLTQVRPLMLEFNDTVQIADSTARIALGPVIQDMQRIRREVMDISAPNCVQGASYLILDGMSGIIEGFIDFMGNVNERTVQRKLTQGILNLTNGSDQLAALAAGRATPVPRQLPTNTPVPTPLPTPIPLTAGSTVIVRDTFDHPWQIRVTNIEIADSMESLSGRVERASGRFAIIFMDVNNQGLSPATFLPAAAFDVEDASGQRFEEHFVVSAYAESLYNTDICASINPNETQRCVAVYDISLQSDYYMLVPGFGADPNGPRIWLDVP